MDGTLTEELLDFDAIRKEIGLPAEGGILEHLSQMRMDERVRAEGIVDRHEMAAAEGCRLHEGAAEVLAALRGRGVKTALLTRNSLGCARRILGRHGLGLDHVATREDVPHKPHGDSILNITRKLKIGAEQTLMVGDYHYDLQAASAAGCASALLRVAGEWPSFAGMATYRIRKLMDVLTLVEGK